MKRILLSVFITALSLGFTAMHVEAKRLGGGTTQGMKRQLPAKPADTSPTQQQATQQAAAPPTPRDRGSVRSPAWPQAWVLPH